MIDNLTNIPKPVLISLAVIAGALILYGVLLPTLDSARDESISLNGSLLQQIETTQSAVLQSTEDQRFVMEHLEEFESLLESDRLIPHTRRTAVTELNRVALARGLTNLSYSFQSASEASPELAGSQPTSGAYRVSLEQVELRVSAPYDGLIYGFVNDITESFPGSAVVQSMTLSRPARVTDGELRDVSEGRSRLADGILYLSWRTAQAAADDDTEGANQ